MPYDNTCKYLAETFPADFATWLLGKPIPLTKLEPSELSTEPIRADSLIFLESSELILHIEFQTSPDAAIPFRMADYWIRLYRKYPAKQICQIVIYLKPSDSALVHQTSFQSTQLTHHFQVVRLWEQPTSTFEQYLGLLPLAPLTNTANPTETLAQVAQLIGNISDPKLKNDVTAATAVISGLVLNKQVVRQLLRSEIMKESVIYQEILHEGEIKGEARGLVKGEARGLVKGEARGLAKGRAEGEAEATRQVAINMLNSGLAVDLIAQFTGLSLEEIAKLRHP